MSRTIRCKSKTSTWCGHWTKAFGYDWEYECSQSYLRWKNDELVFRNDYTIRERTPREKFEWWYVVHGESRHHNARSPSKYHRKHRTREWRTHNKQELYKELHRPEYEGIYWPDPLNCWWDWS